MSDPGPPVATAGPATRPLFDSRLLLKGAAALASGAGIAQVITLGTAPVLARLYTTTDYGHLGVFMAVNAMVVSIGTLQYQQAVLTAETDEEADAVGFGAVGLALALLAVMGLLSLILGDRFLSLINASELKGVIPLLLFATACAVVSSVLSANAIRHRRFREVTISRVASTVVSAALSISLGFYGMHSGLVFAYVASWLVQAVLLYRPGKPAHRASFKEARAALRAHIRFPLFTAPNEFLSQIISQLPLLVLAKYWSADDAGSYAYALRVVSLPISLAGSGVSEAMRPQMADEFFRTNGCRETVKGTLRLLLPVAIAAAVIGAVLAPTVFAFAFGDRWRHAGHLAQWLGLLACMRLLASPISFVVFLRKRHVMDLVISSVYAALTIALFGASVVIGVDASTAVAAYAVVISFFCLLSMTYFWRLSLPTPKHA